MVRSSKVVSLIATTAGLLTKVYAAKAPQQDDNIVLGSYIVEFEAAADNSDFYSTIQNVASTDMQLDYPLFKGASISFSDLETAEEQAAQLASLGSVKNMWPKRIYHLPKNEVQWTAGETASSAIANVKRQASYNETFAPHAMTQVDQLHERGIFGTGIKVGVIDSGIDYTHPALGGCFGPNCLVSYGSDIVGDNYDGTNNPVPDNDPYDGCGGHGTHVAGIIAAQAGNKYGILGAAPGVTIGAYRVFGCKGSAGNDVLIKAYMEAFEAGSQIITASIGGASGWSEDPWAVAVSRIVEAGVPCTVSAGNDGAKGLFYASTASDGTRVTSIASFDNEYTPTLSVESTFTTGNGTTQTFGWTPGEPAAWAGVTLPLWAVSTDATSTAALGCDPYPAGTPDLSDKIVLIRRGTCTFVQKAQNARAAGAKYLMFYNNAPAGATGPGVAAVDGILGSAGVSAARGAGWLQLLAAGTTVTLSMSDPETGDKVLTYDRNAATGGFASGFTTWNPTFELEVKPQLAAVGGSVLSTYPVTLGSYAVLSGTSMSCPLAAAIYALVAEVRKTFDPATIENLLSATSNPQIYNAASASRSPFLAPVVQQGSGMIRAYDAAFATTILSRSSIAFNDTEHLVPTANFTIKNLGTAAVSFDLGHVAAGTAFTFSDDIRVDPYPGMDVTGDAATIALSESKVTVPAGGSAVVSVTVTPPVVDGKRLPVYSGYITLNGTNGDSLSLPYNGVVGSMHSVRLMADAWLSLSSDPAHNAVVGNASFVLPRNPAQGGANVTYPVASADMVFGTRKLDIQLVKLPCNGTATGTSGKKLGSIKNAPLTYIPRDPINVPFDGTLADGKVVPAGSYVFEFAALHIFGDIEDPKEYEVRRSAPFTIRYR
ncbi:peptidase S8/S53 domain-containing protein [Microdochium bolleyi]|uniref:Peptidase S8/S53 domain-containing protein n=1 Tax=Microdochium bolleyi TaxID=196109 RepID=A0A136JCJ7_9PEZI|nr:peptidase S8/S53 domain-containing protein [Microdochium bolleyi]